MSTQAKRTGADSLRVVDDDYKKPSRIGGISARDRAILDRLLKGHTEAEIAVDFKMTQARVNQIRHTPAALSYVTSKAGTKRGEINALALNLIHDRIIEAIRMNYPIALEDLIKIAKLTEPKQEMNASALEMLHAEAERIADEHAMNPETRRQFIQWVRNTAA